MKVLGRLVVTPSEFAARRITAGRYLTDRRKRNPMHRVYAAWADFKKPAVMEWGIRRSLVCRGYGCQGRWVPFLTVFFRNYAGSEPAVRLMMTEELFCRRYRRHGDDGEGTVLLQVRSASANRTKQVVTLWTPDPVPPGVLAVFTMPDKFGRHRVRRAMG